nr:hypothetical protein [Cohnella terricola]
MENAQDASAFGEQFFRKQIVQKLQLQYITYRRFFGVLVKDFGYANPSKVADRIFQSLLQHHWTLLHKHFISRQRAFQHFWCGIRHEARRVPRPVDSSLFESPRSVFYC